MYWLMVGQIAMYLTQNIVDSRSLSFLGVDSTEYALCSKPLRYKLNREATTWNNCRHWKS